jgi:hypothetical protein
MSCLPGDNSREQSNKARQMSALFGSTYICAHTCYKRNISKDLLGKIQFNGLFDPCRRDHYFVSNVGHRPPSDVATYPKGMDTTTISLLIHGLFTDALSSSKFIAPKQEASAIN